eukprot:366289-Chlamydomonas_euryale.AAC.3
MVRADYAVVEILAACWQGRWDAIGGVCTESMGSPALQRPAASRRIQLSFVFKAPPPLWRPPAERTYSETPEP